MKGKLFKVLCRKPSSEENVEDFVKELLDKLFGTRKDDLVAGIEFLRKENLLYPLESSGYSFLLLREILSVNLENLHGFTQKSDLLQYLRDMMINSDPQMKVNALWSWFKEITIGFFSKKLSKQELVNHLRLYYLTDDCCRGMDSYYSLRNLVFRGIDLTRFKSRRYLLMYLRNKMLTKEIPPPYSETDNKVVNFRYESEV